MPDANAWRLTAGARIGALPSARRSRKPSNLLIIEQAGTEARHGRINLPSGRKLRLHFEKAAADCLDRMRQAGGKNLRIKAQQLRMYLVPHFAADRLDQISPFAVARYTKARRDAGVAPATINRGTGDALAPLEPCGRVALARSPADAAKEAAEGAGRIVAFDDHQYMTLMMAIIGSSDPDCWLFVASPSGLRCGI